jgi:3-phenylpropionate/trans-cinnamate dioxygenase ferredoxin reductase subunit
MRTRDVIIVGGGLAAVRTAQMLRDLDHAGTIVLASDEDRLPYDRPPLSKNYLLGQATDTDIELLSSERLEELDVEVLLGSPARRLDRDRKVLQLGDGTEIGYAQLVIATGARANRISAFDGLDGVAYLRTVTDSAFIREQLSRAPRVGVVGGGFIGLEVASVARRLGCEVTVVEMAPAPLAPILGEQLGSFIQAWHEEQGVEFRCGTAISGARGTGRIEELVLADGTTVDVDLAVVGVGIRPNVEWLVDSGLELHRGVVCDEQCRTSDPSIYAAGDVSCRHVDGRCHPCGHWTAAGDHGVIVASSLMGEEDSGVVVQEGYFWSDQYDARLQFAGSVPAQPELTVSSGSLEERKFVALLGEPNAATAVFAMNSPRDFMRSSMAVG